MSRFRFASCCRERLLAARVLTLPMATRARRFTFSRFRYAAAEPLAERQQIFRRASVPPIAPLLRRARCLRRGLTPLLFVIAAAFLPPVSPPRQMPSILSA